MIKSKKSSGYESAGFFYETGQNGQERIYILGMCISAQRHTQGTQSPIARQANGIHNLARLGVACFTG